MQNKLEDNLFYIGTILMHIRYGCMIRIVNM